MNNLIKFLLVACSYAPLAMAEVSTESLAPIVEQHIVETGDTLAKLARKHLGPEAPWNINVQFNRDLDNPNRLVPGQVINIITGYAAPEPEPEPEIVVEQIETYQAVIEQVANEVEKNLKQTDWRDASQGDELFPLDAVRTLSNSSALLRFDGTSEVLVSEYSQVFLRSLETLDSSVKRSEIEIKRGESELRLSDTDAPELEIEINVAGVITRPERGGDGTNATRARMAGSDVSQIMVYAGESAVESAGVSVAVQRGMGTTAVAGAPPAKPERLLEAPELQTIDDAVHPPQHQFSWLPVDGAAHYRFELCTDRRCTQPIQTVRDIKETTTTVENLRLGRAHWRVTAVSASGLDGFTSGPDAINVVVPPPAKHPIALYVLLGVLFLVLMFFFLRNFSDPDRRAKLAGS